MSLNISSYEIITINGDNITPDRLIWRRYKKPYWQILERFLFDNPHICEGLKDSIYLPVGVTVRIPIDLGVLAGKPEIRKQVNLTGTG